ncbi:MAG: DUF3810 domain-containing protein, partial [Polaribacter sp.]|nr:DUF3810 domain-containing protein [Polaribacter sp.]
MKNKKRTIFLGILFAFQVAFVQLIRNYPSFVEHYYSNGIYRFTSVLLRFLFGWIPFSFGDVLIGVLVFVFIRFIYRLFKDKFKNLKLKLLQVVAFLSILYSCFYWFWGFNYFREPLSKNLGFQQTKYTTEQLTTVSENIIKRLNEKHFKITKNDSLVVKNPYSRKEIYKMAIGGYNNLTYEYPQFVYHFKSVKSSLMSLLQTYNGTSGYFNPLTGEAQINDRIPINGYPTTVCHEMAHQLGIAAENEANFIGYLAALSNDDIYFKYAAYRMAFSYLISEVRKRDKDIFNTLILSVNKGVLMDFKEGSQFWSQYRNPIEPLIKKGYNSYLKANN